MMASGFYTGYQHSLLDTKELTVESFLEFYDGVFFHKDYFGYKTVEEARNRMQKNLDDARERLADYEKEYAKLLCKSMDELHSDYEAYLEEKKQRNEKNLEVYRNEMSKMETIKRWAECIPQLEYIWRDFKDPTLYAEPPVSFEEWIDARISEAKRHVEYGKHQVAEFEEKVQRDNEAIEQYDRSREQLIQQYEKNDETP